MTALLQRNHTVLPPAEPLDDLSALLARKSADSVTLAHPDGDRLVLPREIFEVLSSVVEAMARGQAVTIAPVYQLLTTQQAADLIGVSRPTFVRLLDGGEIPYERPGRHRRVRLVDVLDYRERRSVQRRESLDRMVEIAEGSGMYERTIRPSPDL